MKIIEKIKDFFRSILQIGFMAVTSRETFLEELRKDIPETEVSDEEAGFFQDTVKLIVVAALCTGGCAAMGFLGALTLIPKVFYLRFAIFALTGTICAMACTVVAMLQMGKLIPVAEE